MEELRANSNFASQLPFKKEILENPNFLGQFSSMTGMPRNPNLSQLPFMNEILVDSKFSTQLLSMTEIPRNPNFSTRLSSMAETPRTPNFSTQLPSMAEIPRNPHLSQLSSMTEILVNPNSSTQLPPNGHYNGEATTPFLGSFSSCHSQDFTEWSWEEHDACERAYLSVPEGVPNRWELIAAQIPSKSTAEVINYCIALLQDLMRLRQMQSLESTVAPRTPMNPPNGDPAQNKKRKKREPWTKEEHILFLRGLKKHGKGDWKSISRYMEFSKTPAQIASHAQKFFLRLNKRQHSNRSSIHDITTVDDDNDDKAVTLVYQIRHNYTPH